MQPRLKLHDIRGLKEFSAQEMTSHVLYDFEASHKKQQMRSAQANLPKEVEISKEVASYLFTNYVDNKIKIEELDKKYRPGMTVMAFAGSSLFGIITGTFGIHQLHSAYGVYQNIENHEKELAGQISKIAEKVLGSYCLEFRENKFFLVRGEIRDSEPGFSTMGVPIGGHMTINNAGISSSIKQSGIADQLYCSRNKGR